MSNVSKHPHGTFSWADNSSADSEAAKAFYVALFGWGKYEVPIGDGLTYTVFQLAGEDCAALSGMSPDQLRMGERSRWNVFVTVDEVDALADVVSENGGAVVHGPFDVFDSGRMLHIQDPTGARLNLWQPYKSIGAGIVHTVGAMCWNELITNDAEKAKAFYAALLGWDFYHDENHPAQYTHISNRGRAIGGILELPEVAPCWMAHFQVADIEASIGRAVDLGGSVVVPKHPIADGSWFSVLADPAGARFYIMELVNAEP